jgi:hypothetical protein
MAILGKSKLNQPDDIGDMATKVHRKKYPKSKLILSYV